MGLIKVNILLLLESVNYFLVSGQTCARIETFDDGVTDNKQITGFPILEISGTGLVTCFGVCLNYNLCQGVNYNKTASVCQLMADVETTSTNVDSLYSTKGNWPLVNLNGPCYNHDCPDNSKCVANVTGEILCMVVGCIRPIWIPNVNVTKFSKYLWSVGEVVMSPCIYDQSEMVTCLRNGSWSYLTCSEVPPRSCLGAYERKLTVVHNSVLEIDVDGNGRLQKTKVKCWITNSVIETVIEHNTMTRTHITGYEKALSYRQDLLYSVPMETIVSIINSSSHCQQSLKYECHHAKIVNHVFWTNRRNVKVKYLHGDGKEHLDKQVCSCYFTKTCNDLCNCNYNDDIWREDSGKITNKDDLPMIHFWAGDTGSGGEESYVTIGPLVCR